MKHKGPVAINLSANSEKASANLKYSWNKLNTETTFGYNSKQKLPSFSYLLTKELNKRQFVIKQGLNITGAHDHPRKRRNASLKFDFKNMENVCGNIALVYDWTKDTDDFLSVQSSLCTTLVKPLFMGISSTSKIYKPHSLKVVSEASTTNSAFIQYKCPAFVSAFSWLVHILHDFTVV